MAERTEANDLSARRIIGFACNQAFVFFLFYMGTNRPFYIGGYPFERAELFCMLLFMAAGLFAVGRLGESTLRTLFSRPLLYLYAVLMAFASLLWVTFPSVPPALVVAQSAVLGVAAAFLLAAWGRTFGRVPLGTAMLEVFTASMISALICLVFSAAADSTVVLVAARVLPIASVVNIAIPPDSNVAPAQASEDQREFARTLSAKIMAGTLCFGVAAGLMETYNTDPGGAAMPAYPVSMAVFAAFLAGSISLLVSDGFGKGSSLNKSYRLAVFIMMLGVLVVPLPLFEDSAVPGESIVLAGYLGLEAVLVSLFLVVPRVVHFHVTVAFSVGFATLFAGELLGVLFANVAEAASGAAQTPPGVVVAAGVLILLSYVFLFTERDFDALSKVVEQADVFERTCAVIGERYRLSKRESEILAFALRGRTSERIARELSVSKSTVDTHIRRIYAKAGVHSRQQLLDLGEEVGRELRR